MRDKEKDTAEKAIRQQHAMETAFRLFAENGIRMTTFSKYGTYYKDVVLKRDLRNDKGDTKICSIPCSTRSLPAAR